MVDGQPCTTVLFNRAQITSLKGSLTSETPVCKLCLWRMLLHHTAWAVCQQRAAAKKKAAARNRCRTVVWAKRIIRKVKTFKKKVTRIENAELFCHSIVCKLNTWTQEVQTSITKHQHQQQQWNSTGAC